MNPVKRMALLVLVLILSVVARATTVSAAGCGIEPIEVKPIPPVGCKDVRHECVCASNNNCYWAWVCIRN
jgi:hypothetical protein